MKILFQGYSTSETWYAVLDYGTNYCNLHNLITGTALSACWVLIQYEHEYFHFTLTSFFNQSMKIKPKE